MKMKKAICTVLAVLMMASLFVPFSAASVADDNNIYFEGGVSGNEAACVKLRTNRQGEGFCLVLPSTVSSERLTVHFDGTLSIDGTPLVSGEETDVFADKETVSAVINGEEASIEIFQSTLPAIFVSTKSGSFNAIDADKSVKEKGTIVVADSDTVYYNGALKQIKGRGNATWNYAKKPYNIKLDSGAKLLGMKKAKNWCLLANHVDTTFIRNQAMSELARHLGMDFAPEGKQVILYRNGEYAGIYTLTEKIEINSNRIDIADLEKLTEAANGDAELSQFSHCGDTHSTAPGTYKYYDIPNNPENITGGYLLEIDFPNRYLSEASGFVTKRGFAVVIKEPEYASKAQVEYIRDYYQSFEDALFSADGYNSNGKHYSEYIDIDTFAAMYIVQDLSVNIDAGASSYFMYKDADDILKAGPIWDFDQALGNQSAASVSSRYGYNLHDPRTAYVREGTLYGSQECDDILNSMYDHADFEACVYRLWTEALPYQTELTASILQMSQLCVNDSEANSLIHSVYSTDKDAQAEYTAECEHLIDFIQARSNYLSEYYAQDHSAVPFCKGEEPETPTEPPTEPSSDSDENKPSLWKQIVQFFQRIINWFKNLFK